MKFLIKCFLACAVLLLFASGPARAGQCPTVGLDTDCGLLITRNLNGTLTTTASGLGPYDGVEDTLIGVQNNGSTPLLSLPLSSSLTIFGFDGDGACATSPLNCVATDEPNGYGGFISTTSTGGTSGTAVTFGNISLDTTSGTVFFGTNGIPAGGSAWFSLEDAVTIQTLTPGMTPEPSSLLLLGSGLFGLVGLIRRKLGTGAPRESNG